MRGLQLEGTLWRRSYKKKGGGKERRKKRKGGEGERERERERESFTSAEDYKKNKKRQSVAAHAPLFAPFFYASEGG